MAHAVERVQSQGEIVCSSHRARVPERAFSDMVEKRAEMANAVHRVSEPTCCTELTRGLNLPNDAFPLHHEAVLGPFTPYLLVESTSLLQSLFGFVDASFCTHILEQLSRRAIGHHLLLL